MSDNTVVRPTAHAVSRKRDRVRVGENGTSASALD
jgi:hypothetical protein